MACNYVQSSHVSRTWTIAVVLCHFQAEDSAVPVGKFPFRYECVSRLAVIHARKVESQLIFSQLELSCVNHIFMLMKANMMKGNIIIGYTSANPMKSYSTSFMKKRKRMTQASSTTKVFSFLRNCKMISKTWKNIQWTHQTTDT